MVVLLIRHRKSGYDWVETHFAKSKLSVGSVIVHNCGINTDLVYPVVNLTMQMSDLYILYNYSLICRSVDA